MPTTLLVAFLKDMVFAWLSTKAIGFFDDWWKEEPVESAVNQTAEALRPEYDGLAVHLRDWAKRPAVAKALAGFARGEPIHQIASALINELAAVGFEAGPNGTGADGVLLWFFQQYHEALLESEHALYSTKYLSHQVSASAEQINARIEGLSMQLAAATPTLGVVPLATSSKEEMTPEAITSARTLINDGRPRSALQLLELFEAQTVEWTDQVRYELLAAQGSAFVRLNDLSEAERRLESALVLRPTRPNALANLGLVRLLQGNAEAALELANRALSLEEGSLSAIQVKIQALASQQKLPDAKALADSMPDSLERTELLGVLALREGDGFAAVRYFEVAHVAKPASSWVLARLALATVTALQEKLQGTDYAPWGKLPDGMRAQADRALALLDQAVQATERTDDRADLAQCLISRAVLRAFLGDLRADADFSRGLELDRSNAAAVRQATLYWVPDGKAEKAIPHLEALRAAGASSAELDLLYARALLHIDRAAEAETVLSTLPTDLPGTVQDVALAKLETRLARHDNVGADQIVAGIPPEERLRWEAATLIAVLLSRQGKAPEAAALLQDATAVAEPEHRWRIRLAMARLHLDLHQWDEAAAHYQSVLTVDSPPELLRPYVSSLYNGDRLEECLALCEQIREHRGPIPAVIEIEALAHASLGQLERSDDLYAQIQERQPDDPKWRLRRALIAVRQGDRVRAARLLPTVAESGRLSWQEGMDLAGLLSLTGDLTGSLETGYRVSRAHPDVAEAQLRYVGMFFAADAFLGDTLNVDTAKPGTWVTIQVRGQQEVHELLEQDEVPTSRMQHRTDVFFQAVSGKHPGDEIVLADDMLGREVATITEVRSKYVGLFQDTLTGFNHSFPAEKGLRAFGFSDADALDPLKRSLEMRSERVEEVTGQYATMPMPLSMLGKALDISDVEVWEALAGGEIGGPVIVGLGTPEALGKYAEWARSATPLTLEVTSLSALQRLELLADLPRLGRELLVAQSVVDELETLRLTREMELRRPGDHLTLVSRDGQLGRLITSEDALRLRLQFLEDLLAWTRAQCQVVGVHPGPDRHRRTLLKCLSHGAYDSVLCARDKNAVLVSEDMRLRGFAEAEFQLPGIASIHLAGGMLEHNVITADRHNEAIATAAGWNYEFISITHTTLLSALRLDGFLVGRSVQSVLRRLADPGADAGPVIIVASEFLRELMLGALPQSQMQAVLHALLAALASRPDWRLVLPALQHRLNIRLKLHPLALRSLTLDIAVWKQAHLIP